MTTVETTRLGGTASDVVVAKVAHGLMMMTWRPKPIPDEVAFESIKAGIDALPPNVKMFLNSGEFYDNNWSTGNLELLSRFFEKYPEYADRTFLSVKGGILPYKGGHPGFSASPENLRRSVENSNKALRGTKKIDLFESARVDPKIPVEDAMRSLKALVEEGLIDHIGLSECSAETLRRACTVVPVAAVEIEISPFSWEEETKKVLAVSKELGVAVLAYSPLGRGFLTGSIKTLDDLEADDPRRRFTRFKPENFQHNFVVVDRLKAIAEKKNISPSQLCIAWVGSLGDKVIPLPGSSHKTRTLENLYGGNVELTSGEKAELDKLIEEFEVKGDRYFGADPKTTFLWG
ncbi:hypothetical protein NLI96_g6381 [Meripilus lineatus]|uniref:NADP-dependent oxidoreductase domain-containing protein n=1 Tax=Meripilus lineatus TaxID=2056292 RepID=A0AAD5V153_9APHY|nr:hypothetical protein NLI96_g6381 [Physisporinus lineatus]